MKTSSFSKMAMRISIFLSVVAVIFSLSPSAHARPSDAVASPGIQAFQQVSPGTGWILFNGDLFWTKDNGGAWLDITPSSADILAVNFLDSSHGWVLSSGPALSWTSNTGKTWLTRSLDLPELYHLDTPIAQVFMDWRTTSHGWLVFKLATGSNFSRGILFITTDSGGTWSVRDIPLGEPATFTDELHGFVSGGPARDQYFVTSDGGLSWELSLRPLPQPPLDDGIVEQSMSAPGVGWAKWQSGKCTFDVCLQEVKLLATRDGLQWNAMRLPDGQTGIRSSSAAGVKASFVDPDTIAYQGQGFDTCEIPTLSQLQTWWDASPYSAVNLYIGGSMRGCSNLALTSPFLSQLNAQGWRFFPTWVGPQASCSAYSNKMSENTTLAYNEGVAEANLAIEAAQDLGLTAADGSGTVIYYDLEAYNVEDPGCRLAANNFISGWTHQLQARGNLAGVYGAAYSSAVSDWWTIPDVPDAIWIAHWYDVPGSVSFTPDATTESFLINNAYWSNHQRLRQYAGGHDETWGTKTINIDSNVLDGPLTVPNGTGGISAPTAPFNPYPADGASVARTGDTWLRWKTTGDTCSIHVWRGTLDTTLSTTCSLYHLGVQSAGVYSWQVTATNPSGSTLGPVWTLNVPPAPPTDLTALPVSATSVDLAWTASIDTVDNYLVFADGVQVASVAGTATGYRVQNLSCKATHTFYIKSVLNGDRSEPSGSASAATPSCAPVLLSPVGGIATSLQPAFTWQPVADATQYQLLVSPNSNFSTLVINIRTTGTSYTHNLPLLANRLYYWRVRALGPFGRGDWGTSSFTTPNPPPAPLLIYLVANILVTDYTPRFDWRDVTAPAGTRLHYYQIQVSKDSNFTTLVQDRKALVSEFTPLTLFSPNTTFYWRVRGVNTLGHSGAWSAVGIFRTAIRPPVLLSPANGTSLAELRPTFDWKDIPGAASYSFQVSTLSNFASLLINKLTYTSDYTLLTDLPANITLYWRVRANGPNGPSLWSAKWTFRVGVTADSLSIIEFYVP